MPVDLLAHRLVWIREASSDAKASGSEASDGLGSPSDSMPQFHAMEPIDWALLRSDAIGCIQRLLRPLARLWSRQAR